LFLDLAQSLPIVAVTTFHSRSRFVTTKELECGGGFENYQFNGQMQREGGKEFTLGNGPPTCTGSSVPATHYKQKKRINNSVRGS